MSVRRVFLIVLDSVGIGQLSDAAEYGDSGAHTLGHIARHAVHFSVPNLERMGLGRIESLERVAATPTPLASFGKMAEISRGKDTMTGHWELMGLRLERAFRTFPDGFPEELLNRIRERTGRGIVGNKPASGTQIIDEYGPHQQQTGDWIIYTSADSVLQIAAHEAIIPLQELYDTCKMVRAWTLEERWQVGRVIARPYVGQAGAYTRTANRHDYAVAPPQPTLLDALQNHGLATIAIGKINDIFNGAGISRAIPTKNNDDGVQQTMRVIKDTFHGLCFVNLVDFDSLYGHRRDVEGYARALMAFDQQLPELIGQLADDDVLIITADHGNDPTHSGTDHTREYVPLLVYEPRRARSVGGVPLGVRQSFADVAATIADWLDVPYSTHGVSFRNLLDEKAEGNQ